LGRTLTSTRLARFTPARDGRDFRSHAQLCREPESLIVSADRVRCESWSVSASSARMSMLGGATTSNVAGRSAARKVRRIIRL